MEGHRIGRPVAVFGPQGPWDRVHETLAARRTVVVHSTGRHWTSAVPDDPGLRPLLGSDWQRSRQMDGPVARARFVASRLLLKHTAAVALEAQPSEIELAYRPGGRPYLRGCEHVSVSLSHTEDTLVVALSRRGRIGVDVESADRRLAFDEVAGQACTRHERAALSGVPERERGVALLRLWTLKEAYAKAVGQGLRMPFTAFGVEPGQGGLRTPDGAPADRDAWAFATFTVVNGYLVSVAGHDAHTDGAGDGAAGGAPDHEIYSALVELLP
jgi:4'-phosphopantetheinyl transferase